MKPAPSPMDGTVALLDDAFHLLRGHPEALWSHALGAMPFCLGLLWFWSDMSRSAFTAERCAAGALGLASLYLWMKTWHSRCVTTLYARAAGEADPAWTAGRLLRVAAAQAGLQATAFPVLLVGALLVFPSASCILFYQNVLLYCNGDSERWRGGIRLSWVQASARPLPGNALVAVFSLLWLVVFAEVLVGMLFVPQALHLLTGSEAVATHGGAFLLNSTVLAIAGVLSYLALDPLLKAACVLRCFRERSVGTGDDLLVELRRIGGRRAGGRAAWLPWVAVAGLALAGLPVRAEAPTPTPAPIDPPVLRQGLERTLQEPRYAWRSPRVRPAGERPEQGGALRRFLRRVGGWIQRTLAAGRRVLEGFVDWLRRWLHLPGSRGPAADGAGRAWREAVPYVVAALSAAVLSGLAVYGLRSWQRRRRVAAAVAGAVTAAVPDLADEAVSADLRSSADWLQTARDLVARGELRLGLRAAYLASLARLAERRLLTIARCKSNRDYRRELARRAAQQPELVRRFEGLVQAFDRSWYGDHPLSAALVQGLLAEVVDMGGQGDP